MNEEERAILKKLRNEQKNSQEILKILVKERVKITHRNKFTLEDINKWSAFFDMPMQTFMFEILHISKEEVKKLLNRNLRQINSVQFNVVKERFLHRRSKIFHYSRNLNKKIYFNRNQILKQSNKMGINPNDFVVKILCKSPFSLRKVMKDETSKTRLSFGAYTNTRLPQEFINNNYTEMEKMTGRAVNRAIRYLGINMKREDYKDIKQECLAYIFEKGNALNKFNEPIITGISTTNKQKNRMVCQEFYHAISEIKRYYGSDIYYNDSLKYQQNTDFDDVYTCINRAFEDERTRKIFTYLYDYGACENTKQKIMKTYNLTEEQLEEIINVNAVKLQ